MYFIQRLMFFSICSFAAQIVPASLPIIDSFLRACRVPLYLWLTCLPLCQKLFPQMLPRVASSSVRGVPVILNVPASCFEDNVNSVVNDFSLFTMTNQSSGHVVSISTAFCILYVAAALACSSFHHITRSSSQSAASPWAGLTPDHWLKRTRVSQGQYSAPFVFLVTEPLACLLPSFSCFVNLHSIRPSRSKLRDAVWGFQLYLWASSLCLKNWIWFLPAVGRYAFLWGSETRWGHVIETKQ